MYNSTIFGSFYKSHLLSIEQYFLTMQKDSRPLKTKWLEWVDWVWHNLMKKEKKNIKIIKLKQEVHSFELRKAALWKIKDRLKMVGCVIQRREFIRCNTKLPPSHKIHKAMNGRRGVILEIVSRTLLRKTNNASSLWIGKQGYHWYCWS